MKALADLTVWQHTLGIYFNEPSLLEQALMHSSYINENHSLSRASNEKLEFLGDAVLGLIIAEKLCRDFPQFNEGEMTRLRAALVQRETLARMAGATKLGDYLYLGKGEEASGGRSKATNLASALEAVIAAIFLDQGLTVTRDLGDAGKSTYGRNRNSAKTAPKYMETSPTDFLDGMVLTQAEIDAGETIVTDPDDAGYAGDAAVNTAWAAYEAVKAVVPERILRPPEGSRGDVEHAATWANGVWVNEFKRKLDTGDAENDVIFNDLEHAYEFSIAVFDNCGRGEIPPGHNTYGNGQYLLLRFVR